MAIEVVSAVGAGDSFLGGLVAALAAGKPLEEAFRVAVAPLGGGADAGHRTVPPGDVKRLLPKVKIREIEAAIS